MKNDLKIFDIHISNNTKTATLEIIAEFLKSKKQHQIATVNPEFLLESLKNSEFKKILQNTELNTADGVGILWAITVSYKVFKVRKVFKARNALSYIVNSKLFEYAIGVFYLFMILIYPKILTKIIPERITGVDLMKDIFNTFSDKKLFLLGAEEGVARKAGENLSKISHPVETLQCNVSTGIQKNIGTYSGSPKLEDENHIIEMINTFEPDILFVAFGAPKQEIWINKNLKKIPSVKIAIGVGGAFDFWAGTKKRAPKLFQTLGLEWVYRLLIEPSRWKRIFNAVIIFPWKVLKSI